MVGSCLAVCARLTATPMVAVSWGYTPRIKSLCDERGDQLDDAAAAVVPLRQALRRTAEVAERRGLVRRRLGGGSSLGRPDEGAVIGTARHAPANGQLLTLVRERAREIGHRTLSSSNGPNEAFGLGVIARKPRGLGQSAATARAGAKGEVGGGRRLAHDGLLGGGHLGRGWGRRGGRGLGLGCLRATAGLGGRGGCGVGVVGVVGRHWCLIVALGYRERPLDHLHEAGQRGRPINRPGTSRSRWRWRKGRRW